ncbi:sigma 54-interacting transcriptional regulator [Yersinia enterocolitica]|uniref:sigma 54-interacting transcriptional regulator n=1 Tax=Yersinia enterocolitica TaxID=630 RepID=UPI0021ADE812
MCSYNKKHNFTTNAPSNVNVIFLVLRVAELNVPVLITGETSAGKECVEKYIHQAAVGEASPYFR